MPATAALDARAARRVTAATLAAALQGVFYWLILHEVVAPTALPDATPLEVTILQTVRRLEPATQPRRRRRPRQLLRRREGPRPDTVAQPITLPRSIERARHPPIDWSRALQGEARAQELRTPAHRLVFGSLRRSAPAPAAPEFGWDHASTHRLELLPQGGMLLNINDRCAIVIYGLIFPVCRIGRIPANGHLFDHMRDRRPGEPQG